MVETHFRSVVKAVSYRVIGTINTCLVALLLTGSMHMAARIGMLDLVVKTIVFYLHERLWNRVSFGKRRPPEYNI